MSSLQQNWIDEDVMVILIGTLKQLLSKLYFLSSIHKSTYHTKKVPRQNDLSYTVPSNITFYIILYAYIICSS